mmetsp:Transcript_507/g.1769  ORF Transcript_507/g.1769 Transcript_507/m.1769 type:complete len:224 (+) Transcript_507:2504-3175(+)
MSPSPRKGATSEVEGRFPANWLVTSEVNARTCMKKAAALFIWSLRAGVRQLFASRLMATATLLLDETCWRSQVRSSVTASRMCTFGLGASSTRVFSCTCPDQLLRTAVGASGSEREPATMESLPVKLTSQKYSVILVTRLPVILAATEPRNVVTCSSPTSSRTTFLSKEHCSSPSSLSVTVLLFAHSFACASSSVPRPIASRQVNTAGRAVDTTLSARLNLSV